MSEWIPGWKLPKAKSDDNAIACRLFHYEHENGFGIDIGWEADGLLSATAYYVHPSEGLKAMKSKQWLVKAPTTFYCQSAGDSISCDKIPDQQEVLQNITSAATYAAGYLSTQRLAPSQDMQDWAADTLVKHRDRLVDAYERSCLGLQTLVETASQLTTPQPESFQDVLPEKYLVMRSVLRHPKSLSEVMVLEKYIAYDQRRTPYLLRLEVFKDTKLSYFTAKPIYFVTREVCPTPYWMPNMTPSSEAVVFQLPASDANLLAVYSSMKSGGETRGDGLSYAYYWKVDDLNPGVFRLSIHPPAFAPYGWLEHKRSYQGVFTFSTAPLPVYRKYLLGEDIAEEIDHSALANLMLE